ncbi:MAG: heme-copper oxidase subunit III [Chloroflexi bacterium]|nr:heme-copper oxidase subunit III [Chloroflexota bacterium]
MTSMEHGEPQVVSEFWPGVSHRKLGTWFFLVTEIMLFSGLIGMYLAARAGSGDWPVTAEILGVNLAAINTFILIVSSVTMVLSFAAVEEGNRGGLFRFLLLTALLGLIFIGIKMVEWSELIHLGYAPLPPAHAPEPGRTPLPPPGQTPSGSLFGSTYFTLTGVHAAHVLGGVLVIFFAMAKVLRGGYSRKDHEGIELLGLYWHFVDIVWIFLFTIIYLI